MADFTIEPEQQHMPGEEAEMKEKYKRALAKWDLMRREKKDLTGGDGLSDKGVTDADCDLVVALIRVGQCTQLGLSESISFDSALVLV